MKRRSTSTTIKNPVLFISIQYLDPEANQDPVYLAARGMQPRRIVNSDPFPTPSRLADIFFWLVCAVLIVIVLRSVQ